MAFQWIKPDESVVGIIFLFPFHQNKSLQEEIGLEDVGDASWRISTSGKTLSDCLLLSLAKLVTTFENNVIESKANMSKRIIISFLQLFRCHDCIVYQHNPL